MILVKTSVRKKHRVEMGSICDEESTGIIAVETQQLLDERRTGINCKLKTV